MRHRVAFFGSPRWLNSPPLQRIRLDSRITTVDSWQIGVTAPPGLPDITIAMVQLGVNETAALAAMSRSSNAVRWIAVTRCSDDWLMRGCVEAGAWGLVRESADTSEFLQVIHAVGAGRLTYPQSVLDRIVTHRGRMTLATIPPASIIDPRR